jgi:predicted double-glycine peptidase
MLTPVPPDLSSKFSTIWDDAQLVPATKWDEWKERHLPRWWLKNHPVRKIPFAYEFPEYVIKKVSR